MRKGEQLRPQDDLSLGRREEVPSRKGRGCKVRREDGEEGEWEMGWEEWTLGEKSRVQEVLGTG